LVRRLEGSYNPVSLHAALAASGSVPFLFRRTEGRAFLIIDRALSLKAKGAEATLVASSEGGRLLLSEIGDLLGRFVTERGEAHLAFAFPHCSADEEDERLAHPTAFEILRAMLAVAKGGPSSEVFVPLVCGLIGFDHVDMLEDLPAAAFGGGPDIDMHLAATTIVIEPSGAARIIAMSVTTDSETGHRQCSLASERIARLADRIATCLTPTLGEVVPTLAHTDVSDADFAKSVQRLKGHIAAGDIFQCVPSRSFFASCPDPVGAFRRLVRADPSTYQFYCDGDDGILFGASPETAVAVRNSGEDRIVSVSPIAGTRPRGSFADADDRMETELRLDAKENAEHLMLVDLARNDVARVAMTGTRRVTRLLAVERFARVMHLVSRVEGILAEGRDSIDALKCCLNAGTLSGAPKLKAIELIRSVEHRPRGAYGGAVGIIAGDGTIDSAVVIRAAVVRDGVAEVRAGAGVVADSDPDAEAAETRAKARAVLNAIGASI
jgi:anthranilate synthase component 1